MRNVTLDITALNLSIYNVINIVLIDSVGNPCIANNGFTINATITLESNTFNIDLLPNAHVGRVSSYQLTLPSTMKLLFTVPENIDGTPHELLSLCRLGCVRGIINIHNQTLDVEFIEKLDLYLSGDNPYFTASQKAVVELYEYYADHVYETASTIDVMRMMDEYLATILGEYI